MDNQMDNQKTESKSSSKILNNALLLASMTGGCVFLLYQVFVLTKDPIQEQETKYKQQLMAQVISRDYYDNDLIKTCTPPQGAFTKFQDISLICTAKQHNQVTAYVFETTTNQGYSGKIKLLVAITVKGKVLGVRAIQHQETPSLGDKIELKKSNWILSFTNKFIEPNNPNNLKQWAMKKDGGKFDQFTGATITPRAVVNQVKKSCLEVLSVISAENITEQAKEPANGAN